MDNGGEKDNMNETIKLTIPAEKFSAIGQVLGGSFSALSPFRLKVEGSDDQLPKQVMQGGKVNADLLPAFQTIAGTRTISACVYLDESTLLDTCFYFPEEAAQTLPVSLTMADDGVLMESPPDMESVLVWLEQRIGLEQVRDCVFEAELELDTAYTLLGLVDAVRKRVFASMAGNASVDIARIPVDDIKAAMSVPDEGEFEYLHWLAPHFAESHDLKELDKSAIKSNLDALKKKGMLQVDGENIIPGESIDDLAGNFLTVNGHLRLQAAFLDKKDQLRATEVRGVLGQGNAVLLWTEDGKKAQFMGASPAQALAIARDMLSNPDGSRKQMPAAMSQASPAEPVKGAKRAKRSGSGKKGRWWKIVLMVIGGLGGLLGIAYLIDNIVYYFF